MRVFPHFHASEPAAASAGATSISDPGIEHPRLHARNRGVQTIFIHALSENTAMLKLAKTAGAVVEREGSESEARLKLPPDSFASHLDELIGERAAELDYRLKLHAHRSE